MVVRIAELEAEEPNVRFVPRKRRKADVKLENIAVRNASVDADVDPPHEVRTETSKASEQPGKRERTTELAVPAWREHREAQLSEASEAEQPTTQSGPTKWTQKPRPAMTDRDWRIMRADLRIKSSVPVEPLLRWTELRNSQLVRKLADDFPEPMPVQRASIGLACLSTSSDEIVRDFVAIAPTGSGKTLGFIVPIVENDVADSLVLAPTRELALQIAGVASIFELPVVTLVGGHDFADQAEQLAAFHANQNRSDPHHTGQHRTGQHRTGQHRTEKHHTEKHHTGQRVIVATPGRLLDFLSQGLLDLGQCEYLVFDEADRMIDLGFEPQISEIMAHLPVASRRTMMFSATWPAAVQQLSANFLKPGFVKIDISGLDRESSRIKQSVELVPPNEKLSRLLPIVKQAKPSVICFVATKAAAETVASQLSASGVSCQYIHGGLSQDVRDATLDGLRTRRLKCLVATDVASRGVDIDGISLVVNYDLPQSAEIYIHRIGRTGRAGQHGRAISFATDADTALFPDLRRLVRESGSPIPAFLNSNKT